MLHRASNHVVRLLIAQDEDQWYATGCGRRKQRGDDGVADGPWVVAVRRAVNGDRRLRVDFQKTASLFGQGTADVPCDHIQTGNIETNHPRGIERQLARLRMNALSDIAIDLQYLMAEGNLDAGC